MMTRAADSNGRNLLLKILFAAVPVINALFLPWAIWVTTSVWDSKAHMNSAQEISNHIDEIVNEHKKDMEVVRLEMKALDDRLDNQPPQIWKDKVLAMEGDLKQNIRDHADIIVSLKLIEQKLGVERSTQK